MFLRVVFADALETLLRPDRPDEEEEEEADTELPAFFSAWRLFWNHTDTVLTSLCVMVKYCTLQ